MNSKSNGWCLQEKGKGDEYRNKEEIHATTKSGIETMQLKAKESEDFQESPEAGRGNEGLFQRLRGSMALQTQIPGL